MKNLNWIYTFTFLIVLFFISCNSNDLSCYDQEMEENHSGTCSRDCPEVCGCDGKTYCNVCVANSKGILVDYFGRCK